MLNIFAYCIGLTSITIPNSVTSSIAPYAFSSCTGLTNVTIGNSVTRIAEAAFYRCTSLTSITLPNSITSIDDYAFKECSGLTSITIGNNVTSIGESSFQSCSELTSIIIPNSVTSIGNNAFSNCGRLASVTLSNNITAIGYGTFYNCESLTSIPIPDGVKTIGEWAFHGCALPTSLTIPSSVTSIGGWAFSMCKGLTSVRVEIRNPLPIDYNVFPSLEGITLYVPKGCKAAYEAADIWKDFKEIVEPSPIIAFADPNVKAICVANWDTDKDGELSEAEAAAVTDLGMVFKSNTAITSFEELNYFTGLTSIGYGAFANCSSLTAIKIPGNVVSLGTSVLYKCKSLSSILMILWLEASNRWDWTVETICLDGPNYMLGRSKLYARRYLSDF